MYIAYKVELVYIVPRTRTRYYVHVPCICTMYIVRVHSNYTQVQGTMYRFIQEYVRARAHHARRGCARTLVVWSNEPVMILSPLELKLSDTISAVCPRREQSSMPSATSHSFAVESITSNAVTSVCGTCRKPASARYSSTRYRGMAWRPRPSPHSCNQRLRDRPGAPDGTGLYVQMQRNG